MTTLDIIRESGLLEDRVTTTTPQNPFLTSGIFDRDVIKERKNSRQLIVQKENSLVNN